MAQHIGTQHGIDAVRNRLIVHDPEGAVAYKKLMSPADPAAGLEGTMHKLVAGHNEGLTRLDALEQAVQRRPFS